MRHSDTAVWFGEAWYGDMAVCSGEGQCSAPGLREPAAAPATLPPLFSPTLPHTFFANTSSHFLSFFFLILICRTFQELPSQELKSDNFFSVKTSANEKV